MPKTKRRQRPRPLKRRPKTRSRRPLPDIAPGELATPSSPSRRTRLGRQLPPRLRGWLRRTIRVHVQLTTAVRLYGNRNRAGGHSLDPDGFQARADRGDPTILHQALSDAAHDIEQIRHDIDQALDRTRPTRHPPGSPGKIEVMLRRVEQGRSLFNPRDRGTDGR